MESGDTIAFGWIWEDYCGVGVGYPGDQHHLFLPWPGDTSKAVLFYFKIDDYVTTHYLMYATVQFDKDHPSGIVINKDQILFDPGRAASITATKHANGRDWWVIIPEDNTNRFFKVLLSEAGVAVTDIQTIGSPWGPRAWGGQAVFSPDGTKYIRFNPWEGLFIFDFDRC